MFERVAREAYETYNEKWVTGRTLGEYIETMTAAWLKSYGNRLPRRRTVMKTDDGKSVSSPFVYPLHRIQRMIENNEIYL
jgi:hypothetical protein